jgi:DNA processing protein
VTTLPISADGQAIALACSSIALQGERSVIPLNAIEWHQLSESLERAKMEPGGLLGLDAEELQKSLGVGPETAERLGRLLSRGGQLALEIERLSSRGIWLLSEADEDYPAQLKERLGRKAPTVLFGAGPLAGLGLPSIAIIGSRDVDEAGIEFTIALASRCAAEHFAVVSGAARGVDAAAMSGALARGGATIGITVDSLEKLVGRREFRAALADELLTLATPFYPAARWQAGNAMARNKIVYALAQAAVVVASSGEKGGTRAGALENLAAGWVPLHVRDDGSAGNRRLISEGAAALPAEVDVAELDISGLTRRAQDSLLAEAGGEQDEKDEDDRATGVSEDQGPPAEAVDDEESTVESAEEAEEGSADAFLIVWPHLAKQLVEPLGAPEVAERMSLELKQAREWLKRAHVEGKLEELIRPKRFVLAEKVAKQLRIDGS